MSPNGQTTSSESEFAFSDTEFKRLTGIVRELTGIVLGDHKKEMVYGRLARRLRKLGMQSFAQYCALLDSQNASQETGFLVNAITTNLTKFYRESHHFDFLTDHIGRIQSDTARRSGDKKVFFWSAGCSSGEEPYSIASTVMSRFPSLAQWDVKILATDLDTNMLDTGKAGQYPASAIKDIPSEYRRVFNDNTTKKGDKIYIRDRTKALVHFKQLNLLHPWPMKQKYDAIFCRNVLIYFDAETKHMLVKRYTDLLRPGGMLFLGHSESLQSKIKGLTLIGRTAYQKEE
ncbi:CheR family methyltransferase [Sneathiella sp.]|jgi:chemotaxis protein methyltransferase CheR|uniref:CheR family methyltransferase n=1 Tax=Sneathiella sp. TaxID=1964365 RepID=UPI0039E3318A